MAQVAQNVRSVMVVDDDDMVRLALVRTLAVSGYRTQGVASPAAALALLERGERWDMVISDFLMPEMTGVEFLERVRKTCPDTLRLLLTGHAVNQGVDAGDLVCRSLSKPWDNEELRAEIRLAFERRAAGQSTSSALPR
jgi:CheY-like chemotaxis protein